MSKLSFYTNHQDKTRIKSQLVIIAIIAALALGFSMHACGVAQDTQRMQIDQCNIITRYLDEEALRVYCTNLST